MLWETYRQKIKGPDEFTETTVTKETYLDILEIAFDAYPTEQILNRKMMTGEYLELQSYSRLTCVLACLIAGGRRQEQMVLWERMMSDCCQEIHTMRDVAFADFSIKEIMFAIKLMNNRISEANRQKWYGELRKLDRNLTFHYVIRTPEDEKKMHNINVYNMVGEYLRESEGLTDTADYFSRHWPVQLDRFDNNGMYMDPGCPMLYDLTTRCQIQLMLGFGYKGPYYRQIDENLRKSGIMTLFMQSAAFEFPYGGRSNQFLHNEALIAANCEYEALRYKQEGNLELAGAFKRCGHLAITSILRWLEAAPPRHLKNFYPIDSRFGIEDYAYYDKYMITMGAFLAIGYYFADDSIKEAPCPAELGGYVFETSGAFHKIFANAGGYSLEIDTKADQHYDATGLGRIHRASYPTELALSAPLSGDAYFELAEGVKRIWSSITPGWKQPDNREQFLSDLSEGLRHKLDILEESESGVKFRLTYQGDCMKGIDALVEHHTVDGAGIRYEVEFVNPAQDFLYVRVPVLFSNGKDVTGIVQSANEVRITLDNRMYQIRFDGGVSLKDDIKYGNRNGLYNMLHIEAKQSRLSVSFALLPDGVETN